MADLIDQIPDYEPDFGARTTVHFTPTDNDEEETDPS